jgi:murein L,D-transpeptidase YafK
MKHRGFLVLTVGCAAVLTVLFSFTRPAATNRVPVAKKRIPNLNRIVSPQDNPYSIIIDKSDFELQVYDDSGWLSTYPVVFGSKDLGDKMMEGDKKTPDGEFKVLLKKTNKKWGLELLLDYPNEDSKRKFEERKKSGKIPAKARIGNGIAIHGTRPGEEWTVDNFINWTDGCISVKYSEMKELYNLIPQGTPITIRQ